jgi:hypothetical protein
MSKIYVNQPMYDILTVQPINFYPEEMTLVQAQIPGYNILEADSLTIIKAQQIVANYRKTIYEVRK